MHGCVHRTSLGQRMRGRGFLFLLPKTPALPPLSKNEVKLLLLSCCGRPGNANTHIYVPSLSLSSASSRANKTNAGWLGAFCYSSPLAQGGAPTNLVMPRSVTVVQDWHGVSVQKAGKGVIVSVLVLILSSDLLMQTGTTTRTRQRS